MLTETKAIKWFSQSGFLEFSEYQSEIVLKFKLACHVCKESPYNVGLIVN